MQETSFLSLKSIVENLAQLLQTKHYSLVTAESCTGGLLAQTITAFPDCSPFLERGFICYSDESKIELLNVSPDIIKESGAVSIQTAGAMARGALQNSHAHIAVSTTGEAGPEVSEPGNTVGTICFGLGFYYNQDIKVYTFCQFFKGNRNNICQQGTKFALSKLLKLVKDIP